ncbi:MAG TPA: winged helix-turn-helix domain-containing protein, partial [Streptosporangiaceae bacterium]
MDETWPGSADLFIDLDREAGPRRGIESALRQAIRAGRLHPDSALPSSRALAADLGVARGTVSAAYSQLAAEGYLIARQGTASRVAWVPPA